ncbi:MAG TPA: sulfur transferase domain-containing protein [Vicinamibacterales bacterium]|nr:sulfur transferase domain-containing protein [Vicinamibacterales bacterium]
MKQMRMARAATAAFLVWTCVAATASAQAIQRLTVPGINNFWRVDDTVSTGGTITSPEMAVPELKRRGIRTVINLAGGAAADAERTAVEQAGLKYVLLPIDPMALDRAPVDAILQALNDRGNFPIFVHSGAGHRAAAALMIKRVMVDGWTIERAGIEAASAGMVLDNDMAPVWWKFIRDYLKAHGK